jgi:hypothetical protein
MVIDYSLPRRSPTILARLRNVLYDKETTLKVICKEYLRNVKKVEYRIFELKGVDGSVRRIASMVPKRGNPVYAYGVRCRLEELMRPFVRGYGVQETVVDGRTSVLHLDLTYDAKKVNFKGVPSLVGIDFNRYMSNLRRTFGAIHVGRTWEAHTSGILHVHVIVHFLEYSFEVFSWYSKKAKSCVLRVSDFERERVRKHWVKRNGFVNVQGIPNLLEGLRYLEKYIAKASNLALNDSKDKGLKTLAILWAFGKRSFSFGKRFKESIFKRYLSVSVYDLNLLSVTQTFSEQMTLGRAGEKDFGSVGGVPIEKKLGVGKWRMERRFVSYDLLKNNGGIPKNEKGLGPRFSFGLCDSQKLAVSQFLGEVGFSGEGMRLASRSALFFGGSVDFNDSRLIKDLWEKLFREKPLCKPLSVENCRELRVLPFKKEKSTAIDKSVEVESLAGLSGLALYARKLRLATDLLPAAKGRVNPSLRDDGSVRFYD